MWPGHDHNMPKFDAEIAYYIQRVLEKLLVAQLLKEFPVVYGTQRFITCY
jgi:hypothetical protein